MQECGQPPSEIVQELAPGLEFDKEGMPIMPNMVRTILKFDDSSTWNVSTNSYTCGT